MKKLAFGTLECIIYAQCTCTHAHTFPGIVFNMLYEKVFQENISRSCRHRLRSLNDSDIPKLAASGTVSPDDKMLAYLKNRFPADVIVGLAPTLYRNVAMDVHRREKEGTGHSLCVDWLGSRKWGM